MTVFAATCVLLLAFLQMYAASPSFGCRDEEKEVATKCQDSSESERSGSAASESSSGSNVGFSKNSKSESEVASMKDKSMKNSSTDCSSETVEKVENKDDIIHTFDRKVLYKKRTCKYMICCDECYQSCDDMDYNMTSSDSSSVKSSEEKSTDEMEANIKTAGTQKDSRSDHVDLAENKYQSGSAYVDYNEKERSDSSCQAVATERRS